LAGWPALSRRWRRRPAPTPVEATAPARSDGSEAHPLARVSHDLKTPLAGIVGLCDGILRGELAPEQADAVRLVRSSAGVAIGMVDDLLDSEVARVGPLVLRPSGFVPGTLLEECAGLIEPLAREKGLVLRYLASESLSARLRGDGLRIRQVVLNLLSNAVRYTSRGEVRLDARSTLRSDGQGIDLDVEVTDSGPGISEATRARLFAPPDWRADRPAGGGTGLGLYICKLLVERMGGAIGCESAPGRGSTFRFRVPLELAAQLTPPSVPLLRRSALRLRDEPPRRALVVEDDAVSRRVAVRLFAAAGVVADAAHDVAGALALHDPSRHEVVLVDLHLPDGTGRDLAYQLHRRSPAGQEPVFLATSTIGPQERAALASLDDIFQQFLPKPISLAQLREAIGESFVLPEPVSADEAVIDDARWAVLAGSSDADGGGLLAELVAAFEAESRLAIEELRRLTGTGRVGELAPVAHRLRSAAANIGARRLEVAAHQLEQADARRDLAAAQAGVERTATAAAAALHELRRRAP
jgi:signal transduction histidine kinase